MISIIWQTNNGLTGISTMIYLNSIISLFLVHLLLKKQKLHIFDYTNLVVEHYMFQYFYTRLSIFFSFKVYLQLIQYVRKWVPLQSRIRSSAGAVQYITHYTLHITQYIDSLHCTLYTVLCTVHSNVKHGKLVRSRLDFHLVFINHSMT